MATKDRKLSPGLNCDHSADVEVAQLELVCTFAQAAQRSFPLL